MVVPRLNDPLIDANFIEVCKIDDPAEVLEEIGVSPTKSIILTKTCPLSVS